MVQFYVLQIKMGRMQIENVPKHWRAEVEKEIGGDMPNA